MKAAAVIAIVLASILSMAVGSAAEASTGVAAQAKVGITKTMATMPQLPVLMRDPAELDLSAVTAWSQSVGADLSQTRIPGASGGLDAQLIVVTFQ